MPVREFPEGVSDYLQSNKHLIGARLGSIELLYLGRYEARFVIHDGLVRLGNIERLC